MRVIFPSTPRYATKARKAVVTYLTSIGVSDVDLPDLEQAVGEAIANAVEHGFREGSYFEIRASIEDGNLRIEVEDDGPGFEPRNMSPPRTTRGFGITVMRMLIGRVTFLKRGRLVRLERRLDQLAPRASEDRNCS
ncbi:MAG TPA: ATP-binding protein [Candidatus Acidoferrales bacterium]|nr:ATP-binding protein [Candidatus Acidoferrales bacterium]